jgi:hypothetical protein
MGADVHNAQKSWEGGAIADHVTSRHAGGSVVMRVGVRSGGGQATSAITSSLTSVSPRPSCDVTVPSV